MLFYQLDHIVEEIKRNEPSREQKLLKRLVGEEFTKEEAAFVWEKVNDHKWYVGERLKRDVGLRVAAVDYMDNFYDASIFRFRKNRPNGFFDRLFRPVSGLTRTYFVAKSKTVSSL